MKENQYNYTYSSKEQTEIKKIREKYCAKEESKLEQLRRLDASVTKKGTIVSLIVGIIGSLIFGTGMTYVTIGNENMFLIGVLIGIIGLIMIICAYPLYNQIIKKEREKLAPEILKLTDELMK